MAPPAPVSAQRRDTQPPKKHSRLYNLVMTPIIFTSFLFSLLLVDLRHSALRAHYHADTHQPSRLMPAWLHRIVYRYRPYRYTETTTTTTTTTTTASVGEGGGKEGPAEEYYHSKQRKLMKMEAAEAFEMRGAVVMALGVMGLGLVWVVWRALGWGVGVVMKEWVS